jgi:hypothetical protein
MDRARWSLDNLTPNKRYYVHFVNYGTVSASLLAIKVTM